MKILMIEDESDFVQAVAAAAKESKNVELLVGETLGLSEQFASNHGAVEEQLFERFGTICKDHGIDLVLLDTDLSRFRNGLSQSACRLALQQLGIPVCRYSKRHSTTEIRELERLTKLATEGSSSVWVPSECLDRTALSEKLLPWLISVEAGFSRLHEGLIKKPELISERLGPSGVLSELLNMSSLRADLIGYTGQNLFFFSPNSPSNPKTVALRLGYWLKNYILEFPGPILNITATAAYLNINEGHLRSDPVRDLLAGCRYNGPFSTVDEFYIRSSLDDLLDQFGGDLQSAPELNEIKLDRVDPNQPESPAYYCVLRRLAIPSEKAASSPDWIPPGAQTARISRDIYDQLGPMLEQ